MMSNADSKLTRLLQDSLGGNTKTVMIANVGPADYNFDETISTLRFASRAKQIKNQPKINENPKDAMLREFQDEIVRLRAALAAAEAAGDPAALGAIASAAGGKPMGTGAPRRLAPAQVVTIDKVVTKVITKGVSEEKVRELQEQALKAKADIESKHAKEKEEIRAITAQIANRTESLAKTNEELTRTVQDKQKERLGLREKLREVEAKITKGNQLINAAEKQKLALAATKAETHARKLEAERVARELAERQDEQASLTEKYESQEKEVTAKRKKLAKLNGKYAEVKQEIDDLQAEHQREREDLLDEIRTATRNIQLMDLLLEHFVPKHEHEKIEARAKWDDEKNEFILSSEDYRHQLMTAQRPASTKTTNGRPATRPVTDWARSKIASGDRSARYRSDNISELELDMPDRSTRDFAAPTQQQQQHMQQQQMQYYQQQQAAMNQYQQQQQMDQYGGGGGDYHNMMAAMAAAAAQGIDASDTIDDFPHPTGPHDSAAAAVGGAEMYGSVQGGAADDDYNRPRTARATSRF